jgi:outer membrane protein assembly factor BamD
VILSTSLLQPQIMKKILFNHSKVLSVILFIGFALIPGCSKATQHSTSQVADEVIFKKGETLFNKKKYARALEEFKTLKEQYPKSKYLSKAQFYIAECYYAQKQYEEAIAAYQSFINLYPTHPEVPQAQYKLGMCYYKQILSADRDQTNTRRALEEFDKVRTKYPHSEYAQKAQEKIRKCRNRLAEHEVLIAEFYLREQAYKASIDRLRTILQEYADTDVIDKTLFYLGMNYLKLGQKEEAELYLKRLIQNYPNNGYAEKARKELSNI